MSLWAVQRNRSLGCEGQEGHLQSLRSSTLDQVHHQLCEHGHSWSTCSWQLELQALWYKQWKKSGSSQLSPIHSASRTAPFQQPGFSLWSDAAYCWPTCNHHFWSYLNLCFVNDVQTSDLVSDSLSSCLKFHFLGLLLVCNCLSYKSNLWFQVQFFKK